MAAHSLPLWVVMVPLQSTPLIMEEAVGTQPDCTRALIATEDLQGLSHL
jgi:hypothetical protein